MVVNGLDVVARLSDHQANLSTPGRSQFRALVAWNVLEAPLQLYPRWLVEVEADTFTHFVP